MNKHELFASANSSCRARRQEEFRFGLNREATLQGLSRIGVWMFLVSSLYVLWGQTVQSQSTKSSNHVAEVSSELKHDVSPALRTIPPMVDFRRPRQKFRLRKRPNVPIRTAPDPTVQSSPGPLVDTIAGLNILGVGAGFTGPGGAFRVDSVPSDSNGVVGATQFVEWVNTSFAVFDKETGAVVYGPAAGNTLWSGFGGGCETNNDGDPIAQYDKAKNRWVMTQFSVSSTPYLQCVAVSTTSDATGPYYRYAFQMPNFPDYPKLGVWPDAYYVTFLMYDDETFLGPRICAFDRSRMLKGAAATQQCVQFSPFSPDIDANLLPSDLDGATPPPPGSPNYLLGFGLSPPVNGQYASLELWKFHVDWENPANNTLAGPTSIPVSPFSLPIDIFFAIPQLGTTQRLDSLSDLLMYRLAYRNFGDHESLVVNHAIALGTASVGVRWYELRNPGGTPILNQQGTYARDSNFRWNGSIAMDKAGDIALGYSVSSSAMHPAIRYTGRVPSDPLGTMEVEKSIMEGGGSQPDSGGRWGDYTTMSVDPVDDCTFWFVNQYLQTSGDFNWSTRIASFIFPRCASLGTAPVISGLPAAGCTLSPANHKLVQVATVTASGSQSGLVSFEVTGTSNEPPGSHDPDIVITGAGLEPRVVQLRAERLGTLGDRIYTLTATAKDLAGNTATAKATCTVPHDQGSNK